MSSDAQQPLDEVTSFSFTRSNPHTHTHTLLWVLFTGFGLSLSTPAHVGIITSLNLKKTKVCLLCNMSREIYGDYAMHSNWSVYKCANDFFFFLSKRNNIAATMYWCQRQMIVLYFVHSNIGNIWPLKCVCHLCVCVFKSCKIVYGRDEQVAAWITLWWPVMSRTWSVE